MNKLSGAVVATVACLLGPTVGAAGWGLCGVGLQLPERPVFDTEGNDQGSIHVSADNADLAEEGMSVLEGNVQVMQGSRQIQADTVRVTRPERILDADGNIRFWDEGLYISGESAHVDLESEFATVDEASYIVMDAHARGGAGRVTLTSRDLLRINDATYTTCNPDDEVWALDASEIELDRISEWGLGP